MVVIVQDGYKLLDGGPFHMQAFPCDCIPFKTFTFTIGKFTGYYTSDNLDSNIFHSDKKLYWKSTK